MKVKLLSLSAIALALAFGTTARSNDDKDIVDTAAGNKDFATLVTAIKEAGLAETLKGKGPFTVFAPSEEAFKKVGEEKIKALLGDKDMLKKVLMAHVVQDKSVMAADVVKLNGEKVNGFKITVDGDKVKIGDANVTKTDIKCSNGVIHVIDTVLMPETK